MSDHAAADKVEHFIRHVDHVLLPKHLNTDGAYNREAALLAGAIEGITKLDASNTDQRRAVDDIYSKARAAVLDTIRERGETCPGFAKWSHGEDRGNYREQIQNWLGKSVAQFAMAYRERVLQEKTGITRQ